MNTKYYVKYHASAHQWGPFKQKQCCTFQVLLSVSCIHSVCVNVCVGRAHGWRDWIQHKWTFCFNTNSFLHQNSLSHSKPLAAGGLNRLVPILDVIDVCVCLFVCLICSWCFVSDPEGRSLPIGGSAVALCDWFIRDFICLLDLVLMLSTDDGIMIQNTVLTKGR